MKSAWRVAAVLGAFAMLLALGCASGGGATAVAPGGGSYTTRLMNRKCGGCHPVPNPAAMSSERWLKGLGRMKQRIALEDADWDSLAALAVRDSSAR